MAQLGEFLLVSLKRIVNLKTILSSITHSHIVPNLYDWLSSAGHKRRYSENISVLFVQIMEVDGVQCCFGPGLFLLTKTIKMVFDN